MRGGGGESIDLSVRRIFLSKCIQLTPPRASQVELGPLRARSDLRVRSHNGKKGGEQFFHAVSAVLLDISVYYTLVFLIMGLDEYQLQVVI